MGTVRAIAVLAVVAAAALVAVRVLHPLPRLEGRTESVALTDTEDTRIGRGTASAEAAHPGLSGIYPLLDSRDAFAARMLLASAAERSLDVQYYIWRRDRTGTLLLGALRDAANRGVRVRLLLDDNNTGGLDAELAALDSLPNFEVRLFNPFVLRSARALGFATDFFRLNRRMHNKTFTADNQATIIGGRNIGDEYFDAIADAPVFVDLDVLAIGPVVEDVSADFDRYWASASSYPVALLLPPPPPGALDELAAAVRNVERGPNAAEYLRAIRESAVVADLVAGKLQFEWAPTRMISDDPAKGLGLAPPEQLFTEQLREVIGAPQRDLELVSPYFVPTAAGVDSIADMARRGVRIRVLVNSLAATDVAAVHSGYAKRRKALLEAGVELFEMHVSAQRETPRAGRFGSSQTSLHAKTFAVDRSRVFIGSFNFDPRSANLNTELGFVIESAPLAERIARIFDERIPAMAYRVHLDDSGDLYWTELHGGDVVTYDVEPGTSFMRRALVSVLSWLPIESLL